MRRRRGATYCPPSIHTGERLEFIQGKITVSGLREGYIKPIHCRASPSFHRYNRNLRHFFSLCRKKWLLPYTPLLYTCRYFQSTTMRFIAVFNLPVILLALVVGATATPLGGTAGGPGVMDEGLSAFAPLHFLFIQLVNRWPRYPTWTARGWPLKDARSSSRQYPCVSKESLNASFV